MIEIHIERARKSVGRSRVRPLLGFRRGEIEGEVVPPPSVRMRLEHRSGVVAWRDVLFLARHARRQFDASLLRASRHDLNTVPSSRDAETESASLNPGALGRGGALAGV